jgi:glycosyltransferase involved in cell wall biosynthesis
MRAPQLTIAVIARDEEAALPRLFASLAPLAGPEAGLATQIVVVDTGSRDNTRNLAVSLGAEVHDFRWRDDFSAARNHALSLARGEWILTLDADDVLPPETGAWLRDRLAARDVAGPFAFRVRSPGPDGSISECSQIRLFPNRRGLRYRNPIHETLGDSVREAGLEVGLCALPIVHEGYRDAAAVARKRRRNLALLEKAVTAEFPPPSLLLAWARMHMAEEKYGTAEKALRRIVAMESGFGKGAAPAAPGLRTREPGPVSPASPISQAARIDLGQCLMHSGKTAQALAVLSEAAPSARGDARHLLEYGKALWLSGRAAEARKAWQDAVAAGPGDGPVPTDWTGVIAGAEALLAGTATSRPSATPSLSPAPTSLSSAPASWSPAPTSLSSAPASRASAPPARALHPSASKPPFSDINRGPAAQRSPQGDASADLPARLRKPVDPEPPRPQGMRGGRRLDLSVCSIFKNEIGNLTELVPCLPLSRIEWIVVDTGSKDGTPELIGHLEAKLHRFEWVDDFAAARNESLKHATRGWILWLDADDRIDENFWDLIEKLLDGPRRAYRFVVRSPREDAQGESFRQIRLIPNGLGIGFEGRIHEQLGSSLHRLGIDAVDADLEILHTGYDSASKRAAKLKRNYTLLLQERREHPKDPTVAMEFGNCLYQMKDYAGAKEVYLSMLPAADPEGCGSAPSNEVLRHYPSLLGETCGRLADESSAEAWFRLSLRWNPSDLQPHYRLGKQALARGDVRGALGLFQGLLDQPIVIGKVAGDNRTVRRNALGIAVLCELQLVGPAKAHGAKARLEEIIAGGLKDFPLDYRVPFEFFRDTGDLAGLTVYARKYLELFPDDVAFWEDFLEQIFAARKHAELLAIYAARPDLSLLSGTLEAFRARSLEAQGAPIDEIYAVYRKAIAKFPDDPTLLVYFSDFVNHNRLYVRCYADLKAMPNPPPTVREFLRQLEDQGLGSGEAAETN